MKKAKRISTRELTTIYEYLPGRGVFNNATIQAILMRIRPDATKNQIEGIPEPMIKRRLIERVSTNRFRKVLELPAPEVKQTTFNFLPESESPRTEIAPTSATAPVLRPAYDEITLSDAIAVIKKNGGKVSFE